MRNDFGTTQNKLHRPVSVAVNDNGKHTKTQKLEPW